jgi:hypothetical protein
VEQLEEASARKIAPERESDRVFREMTDTRVAAIKTGREAGLSIEVPESLTG